MKYIIEVISKTTGKVMSSCEANSEVEKKRIIDELRSSNLVNVMIDIRRKLPANQHDWTFLPELGPDWEWCGLCSRARKIGEAELYTYEQAKGIIRGHEAQ